MTTPQQIPLFPLGLVLFPQQVLPLHIFEERYQLMIGECLRDNAAFGVVLIKEGREVGYGALPFSVGTTAKIGAVQHLEQGRMNLRCVGEKVFRIQRITQERPYLRGEIEMLEYGAGPAEALEEVVASVKERFSTHLHILAKLSDREPPAIPLDLDPESLSYLVGGILAVQMPEKQQLLELSGTGERLRKEAELLARENRALQTFLYLRAQAKKDSQDPTQLSNRISLN